MKSRFPYLAAGLVLGATLGALTALLFTTEKGKELQKQASDSAKNLKNDIAERIESLKKLIEEKMHRAEKP
ncbi:MAG: YtxH domain-containing protein [Bacteroidales bacterium]|nr:YtxH domain-containing protein [Bacteroidales bacterium]MDP2235135.1 YtxH domain-containing protein [Bacteroidales bacterium]